MSIGATRRAGCSTWARVLGVPHIVARFDSNGELGLHEVVHGACRAGPERGVVLHGVVLLDPALEEAEGGLLRAGAQL